MPVMGTCPYDGCGGDRWIAFDEERARLPMFHKGTCDDCGKTVWTILRRWDPLEYTEQGFNEKYVVNEETKVISERRSGA